MSNSCAQEHCLMGMRGSMKRDADSEQVHANIDLDVILEDEPNDSVAAATGRARRPSTSPRRCSTWSSTSTSCGDGCTCSGATRRCVRVGWPSGPSAACPRDLSSLCHQPARLRPPRMSPARRRDRTRAAQVALTTAAAVAVHFCRGGRRICICLQLRPETGGLCCVRWLSAVSEESSARTRQSESLEGPADPPLAPRLVCWRRAVPVSGAHADALSSSRRHLSNAAPAATARAAGAIVPRVGRHHLSAAANSSRRSVCGRPATGARRWRDAPVSTVGPAARLVGRRVAQASAPLSARRAAPAAAHTGRSRCAAAAAADGRRGTTTTHADYWLSTGVPSPARQTER